MAKETVEAVRQAELNAIKVEKDAADKRDVMLIKAEEDAKITISSMTKESRYKAEQDLEQAQCQGAKYMEEAVLKAEKEIRILEELIKSKEQTAINLVLSEVI